MTPTPVFPQTPTVWAGNIISTQAAYTLPTTNVTTFTNLAAIVPASTNGVLIEGITLTSTEPTTAYTVIFVVGTGASGTGNQVPFAAISVPATAGTSASVPSVSLFSSTATPGLPVDANNNRFLYLPPTYILYVGVPVAISSSGVVSVFVHGAQF
jgi:hypothetical protein